MIGPRLRQGSCRLCLWESNSLWDIFGELAERRNFIRKIQACVNIIVSKDDGLSSLICPNCIYKIELFYDFQTSCKRSDEIQKRYNGFQDGECSDCDAVEDVHPVSNSHKDAQGPVETIDIKEEPLDDYEVADGEGDEQFEDAEAEIEVVTVAEDSPEEAATTVPEHRQQDDKSKGQEAEAGGNGSCLQLTPPRSPSVASEVTYSASEAAGSASDATCSAESDSPEAGEGGGPGAAGSGEGGAPGGRGQPKPPPPPCKYSNRCRFCLKWFQKTAVCRAHEQECAPLRGYAPPPAEPPGSGRRCRFCSLLFVNKTGRAVHEYHCVRRQGEPPARPGLPPPAKYCQQCRFCRKYFRRLLHRRLHERQCGVRFGYTPGQLQALPDGFAADPAAGRKCSLCGKLLKSAGGRLRHENYCRRSRAAGQCRYCHARFPSPAECHSHEVSCTEVPARPEANPASPSAGQDVIKCRYCGKGHLKWRSLMTHEFHCRRKAPPRAEATAKVGADREVPVPGSGTGDGDGTASPVGSTASENQSQGPPNRCSYCRKWFRTKKACKVHEYFCSRDVRMTVRGRYVCSFCPRRFLKRNSFIIHERHCRRPSDGTGDSTSARRAEPAAELDREWRSQLAPPGCEASDESNDGQEVMSPGVPEPEPKRKKLDIPSYTPVSNCTKETDTWACQYCDRVFKYRECLRSHEVTCSAMATYQYSMPYHRQPSFFKCPLCRKAFRFRRKLHNHWNVCKVRTSVVTEVDEQRGDGECTPARSEQSEGNGAGGTVMLPFGNTSSPGEDREEWRGWPSSHSPTVVDLVTDDESSTSVVDFPGLSCKLCKKNFCSRVLLELHTLNECVYQRIRNDHAYAQCESPSIDESTLMRRARVELQRLLLCSCCGSIFTDRQALVEHEQSERQRHIKMPTEVDNTSQYGPEATHPQKRIKLGKVVDKLDLKQEVGDRRESSYRLQQQTTSDQAVPTKIKKMMNADSWQDSNKDCLLEDIFSKSDIKQIVPKVDSEKQINGEVSIQEEELQQLESMGGEQELNNKSVLRECVRNNCNLHQLKEDVSDIGLKQGSQIEVVNPQYQESPPTDHKQQLQSKLPNHTHLLQQQQLEDPKNRSSVQTCSEENHRVDTTL